MCELCDCRFCTPGRDCNFATFASHVPPPVFLAEVAGTVREKLRMTWINFMHVQENVSIMDVMARYSIPLKPPRQRVSRRVARSTKMASQGNSVCCPRRTCSAASQIVG